MGFPNLILISVWILYCLHQPSHAAVFHQPCFNDADCMDANYCDYSSQNCEACIPCITLFNRLPATDARNCARSEDDCGVCLPGYLSEDLTGQRRSYKCYPILDESPNHGGSETFSKTWDYISSLSSAIVLFAAILVAFATYYLKRSPRLLNSYGTPTSEGHNKHSDSLPPPYNQVVESQQTFTCDALAQEELNLATPIGRFHVNGRGEELDPEDLDFGRELQIEVDSPMGSTETIPSLWEPSVDIHPNEASTVRPHNPSRLVRSLSLTTVNLSNDSTSSSCPTLFTSNHRVGINCHRHVLLSHFRRASISEPSGNIKVESEPCVDFSEPLPPYSFSVEDSEQQVHTSRARILFRSLSAPEENSQITQELDFLGPFTSPASFSRTQCEEEVMASSNKRRRQE